MPVFRAFELLSLHFVRTSFVQRGFAKSRESTLLRAIAKQSSNNQKDCFAIACNDEPEIDFLTGLMVRKTYRSTARFACCIFLLLFCLPGAIDAQYRIPFINYTMKDGLVQNQVRDICQDRNGYIWFATASGVSRFDGKNFKNFTVADGLPANTVTALLVDRKNSIWMATQGGGLTVFDGKTFRTYTVDDGLASNYLVPNGFDKLLLEDSQGNIWCRTNEEGVSVIDMSGVKTYNKNNGLIDNEITCFKEDSRGRIICAGGGGISVIDRGEITDLTLDNARIGRVTDIVVNRKGEIWMVGNQAVQFVDDKTFVYHPFPRQSQASTAFFDFRDRLWIATAETGSFIFVEGKYTPVRKTDKPIAKIYEDSRHDVWLLTQGNGLYRLSGDKTDYYNLRSGLVDNTVTCIFEDEEGNIWIGTDSGVSMYGKVIFEALTVESGFPNNHVLCVATDSFGNVWCGPNNSGLARINGEQLEFFLKGNSSRSVVSIAPASNGLILGSMGAGIGCFSNGRIIFDEKKTDEDVYDILTVNDNDYWAASSRGLIHVRGSDIKYYTVADGLPDDYIFFLARDAKGRIWCTTSAGLSIFDGERFTNYTVANGLPSDACTDIAIDKYGDVWVGTENGLCRIAEKDGKFDFRIYTVKDGLISNSINLVHADASDRLWIGYVNGLNAIDLKTDHIDKYTDEDGYLALDSYIGAAATDMHGNVWFGTVEGLVKYNPKADRKYTTPPHTRITDITEIGVSGDEDIVRFSDGISPETGLPVNLVLPHNRNNIRIDWIGIHFTVPSKNRYRFILEGYEDVWHEASTETFREYNRLSPGNYTFKVAACNNDGVWNPEPVTYSFTVRRPWWATGVAYVMYALLLTALIYFYIRWRERKLLEENRILEAKVYERTVEIELQKQNIIEINKELKEHQEELIVQRDMAAEQRDQIDGQRREIMDSIRYARRIQNAIMPEPTAMREILPDHFLFFRPRDVVSGDYYWAAKKGNKSIVAAADCTGHGVPGAFMSMLGISFLNEIVLKQETETASQILDELRANIKFILSQTGAVGEQRDGIDMALCIIDSQAGELQYAGAYNSLLLIRAGELIEYKADKMPVGIHVAGREAGFTNNVVPLERGDMLYIFSDGYIDQFGGANNSKFKSKPFKQLLIDISVFPTERQKEILVETHDRWKGDGPQIDDVLVIGIRV